MAKKEISRRDFLRGAAASAAGLATMGVLGACTSNASQNAGTTVSGTTASGTTAATTPVATTASAETPAETTAAAESLTTTSDGKPSFMTCPYHYIPADAAHTIQTEVVIVGAGNAGCAAACSCVENGSQVIVLEAQNMIHGQGGGIGMANTKFIKSLVDEGKMESMTDVTLHQNIWVQRCGSRVKESLVSKWFNNSPATGDWLIDKCAEYGVFPASFRAHAPKAFIPESYDYHMFMSDGSYTFPKECGYFAATNVLFADSRNAEKYEHPATYFFATSARQLYKDDSGRIAGVFAEKNGELILFLGSKGVILATGGIHEDAEMVRYYCDDYVNRVQRCEHGPTGFSTGDGHKMGLWAGAKMQDGPFPLMLHPQANAMFHGCFPFLNQEGFRFMNEGTWVQGKSMNIMQQTGNIAWSIFDKNWAHYNTLSLQDGKGGGMFWDTMGAGIGQPFDDEDLVATVESDVNNGNTIMADTLEELAEKTGIPYENMKATLDRYNEQVKEGVDNDFHKPADFLYPVEEGPFYAAKVGVALLAIVGGLMVDDHLNVVDEKNQPIPGLYATGNASGGLYAIDYPINMAGNSNGRCVIWGYLLGQTMAEIPSDVECTDIASCGVDPAPGSGVTVSDAVYKDGTYEGTGNGRNGEIKVQVTIADGKVSEIVCVSHLESDNIGAPAIDKMIPMMVEANGTDINKADAASGASMTFDGFKEAVDNALAQAQ